MFCKKCGKEIEDNNKYCNYCGELVESETIEYESQNYDIGIRNTTSSKRVSLATLISGGIGVLIIVVVLSSFIYWKYKNSVIEKWQIVSEENMERYIHLVPNLTQEEEYKQYCDKYENAYDNKNIKEIERYSKKIQRIVEEIESDNELFYKQKFVELQEKQIPKTSEENRSVLVNCVDELGKYNSKKDYRQSNEVIKIYEDKISQIKKENAAKKKTTNTQNTVPIIINGSNTQVASVPNSSSYGQNYYTGPCIFPESSSTYLTVYDLSGLSSAELRIARNEIFARKGRIFSDKSLKDYFYSLGNGYVGCNKVDYENLNAIEKANINLIQSYE